MKVFIALSFIFILGLGCSSPNPSASKKEVHSIIPIQTEIAVGIAQISPEFEIIPISSQVSGTVSKILKKENDSVKAGETLLELDHSLDDAKLKQMEDDVNTQKDQIQADEASVGEYRAKYSNAELNLKRLENLLSRGSETQQTVDDARTNLLSYESNFHRLENLVKVSKSKLLESLAATEVARQEKDLKIIRSPVNGKILEITPVIGSSIDSRNSFGQISPKGKIIATGEIDEANAGKIKEGQKAWIRYLGSQDTLSTGTVYFASSYLKKKSLFTDQPGEKEDRRVREIKILLDHPEKLLLNSRVECVINLISKPQE
jgi:multidrug resistance efflux pump